jgi:quercetin dioxygenase-like cupin family protein
MRRFFAAAATVAVVTPIAAFAQEPQVAPEHLFKLDPSGGFSRTVFETDEDPNFKITIRDFVFPPDKQSHTVTLPSAAFVHLLSGEGEISIAKKPLELAPGARSAIPAGAPMEVVNNGEHPVVVRALIVEAK